MKIPYRESPGPSVAPARINPPQVEQAGTAGSAALTKGMEDFGKGVGSVGDMLASQVGAEQHRASVAIATDKQNALKSDYNARLDGGAPRQQGATVVSGTEGTTPPSDDAIDAAGTGGQRTVQLDLANPARDSGFLSLSGKDAMAARGSTLDYLDKRRNELANSITDAAARKLFLGATTDDLLRARDTVERHTSQQLRASELDAVKGLQVLSLRDVANSYSDDKLASDAEASVVGRIGALSLSEEGKQADIADWQSKITSTRLNQFIAAKDWQGAQSLYAREKGRLNANEAPHFAATIATLRDKEESNGTAFNLVNAARQENGFVDTAKAITALQALPKAQRTPEVEANFEKWLHLESQKQEAVTGQYFNRALSAYLGRHQLGDVSPSDEVWLRDPQNAPGAWHRLEEMAKADKRHPDGTGTVGQQAAMARLMVDVADNPDKYATMSAEEFNKTWFPQLGKTDRTRASELLAHMHAQANKPDKMSPIEQKLLLQKGREAGVFDVKQNDVSKWDDEQAQNFYAAQEILAARINAAKRAAGGKAPPLEKVEEWVNQLLLKGKNPDKTFLGFGGDTTLLESQAKGTGFTPKWSDDEKTRAAESLRKRGARVDDAAVDIVLRKVHGLPALPVQAPPAVAPDEVTPGQWGLDLTPPEEAAAPGPDLRGSDLREGGL